MTTPTQHPATPAEASGAMQEIRRAQEPGYLAEQIQQWAQANVPRDPKPNDLLTVANIEPIDGGNTLTLLASDLGNLIDIVGDEEASYRVHITSMRRDEFEAMEEFDGF